MMLNKPMCVVLSGYSDWYKQDTGFLPFIPDGAVVEVLRLSATNWYCRDTLAGSVAWIPRKFLDPVIQNDESAL